MGLTVKKVKVSWEIEQKITAAKLHAKALREQGLVENFSDDLIKEDEEYMIQFRKGLI